MLLPRRRLVICFDGTWDNADSANAETNVALLARTVRASSGADGVPQITSYMRGVGSSGIALERLISGATGEGIDENIRTGYMFLAQNYVPGDQIYLFGFSRGAFTARSLVGLITACGLLNREYLGHISDAWTYYRKGSPRTPDSFCTKYGVNCHREVTIDFLGVWDTVGSLGIPGTLLGGLVAADFRFHDTSPSKIVRIARHALAIDEHRDAFEPTLWTGDVPAGSDIKQVWFAGAHSDVGGGYKCRDLAEIPLRWMAQEAVDAGLQLELDLLTKASDLKPLAGQHESRQGWSIKDKAMPTIREIDGAKPEINFFERLFVPMDASGNILRTINESLHDSARARFGQNVVVLDGDDDNKGAKQEYRPKNLAAAIAKAPPRQSA